MASQRIFMGHITTGSTRLVGIFNGLVSPLPTAAEGLGDWAMVIQELKSALSKTCGQKGKWFH
jgi:hypothetical protein